ncbi:MAG: 3'-5' exonuclease, partial [Mesorhizobium sp.]
ELPAQLCERNSLKYGHRRGPPARSMLQGKQDRTFPTSTSAVSDSCLGKTSGRGRLSAMPKETELKPASGATPLIAIAAAAVDTETTGPDATKARVIQIGAIGIAHGKVVQEAQLDLLIDPGEAIPSEASLVHGITDADVDGAGSFPDAWAQFQAFIGDRILVGHS